MGTITQLAQMAMKGFKYKLDLTKSQRLKVDQTLENARFVFNHFLDRRIKQYEDFKKSGLERKDFKRFTYFDDAKTLTELKKIEGFEWLKVGANETLQQCINNKTDGGKTVCLTRMVKSTTLCESSMLQSCHNLVPTEK